MPGCLTTHAQNFQTAGCSIGSSSSRTIRVEKLRDVVGLYLDPPAHAIVLSVDEKSQIQALGGFQREAQRFKQT